jgi:hypothetical protein
MAAQENRYTCPDCGRVLRPGERCVCGSGMAPRSPRRSPRPNPPGPGMKFRGDLMVCGRCSSTNVVEYPNEAVCYDCRYTVVF